MLSHLVLSALLVSAYSFAVPNPYTHVTHEQIDSLPPGWIHVGDAPKDALLTLRAYLTQDQGAIARLADAVSNPSSIKFGKHLSAEELASSLPDCHHASTETIQWLDSHNVIDYQTHEQWIDFTITVAKAEDMLSTEFSTYTAPHDVDASVLRTQSYSLPQELQPHIDFIYPTVHFFSPPNRKASIKNLDRRQHVPTGPANCSNAVCPPQLRTQYNITYRPQDNSSGSMIGIPGFLNNVPNITDVKEFITQYGGIKDAIFPYYEGISINNGTLEIPTDSGALTVEAELDLDYAIAFTGPLDTFFYSVGGTGTQLSQPGNMPVEPSGYEPFLNFTEYLLALDNPPQVISISYTDDEQSVPEAYANRVCDSFAKLATRGISVIVASGDGGASGTGGNTRCEGPSGEKRFIPTFPASCPWVTTVGATADYGGAASFSSGGLSNYFARPSWQDQNVTDYLKALNGSHDGYYNSSGRGIPDLSLLGDDYLTLGGSYPSTHDGSSASTPVFAAMIALINDIRLRNGKPVLGFLNPLLYAANASSVYRDVEDGSSIIGCANSDSFEPGWEALRGWDAATGLGEPDFERLRALLE